MSDDLFPLGREKSLGVQQGPILYRTGRAWAEEQQRKERGLDMASPIGRCQNGKCLGDIFIGDAKCRSCGESTKNIDTPQAPAK